MIPGERDAIFYLRSNGTRGSIVIAEGEKHALLRACCFTHVGMAPITDQASKWCLRGTMPHPAVVDDLYPSGELTLVAAPKYQKIAELG